MSSDDTLSLAALQIEPSENLTDTLMQIQHLTEQVLAECSQIDCLVLPEYAFGTFREWSTSKHENHQLIQHVYNDMSDLARKYKIPIIAGSLPYRTEENQWRNRSFLFASTGELIGSYDKQHPFRAEKRLGLEPGIHTPVFCIQDTKIAILICSDLWFHHHLSVIAEKTDFIAVPAMTTVLNRDHVTYGRWAWHSLVAVRAKEYTIPIVSADQAFREYAPGVFTCGGSCIADPSYRFTEREGPNTQALRIADNTASTFVISKVSIKAIREYKQYRREVGLREEKKE
jgi:predicted amidohydrolase